MTALAPDVHPTAVVHPGAELAPGVQVGPYAVIEEHVKIGKGTVIGPHAVLSGHTEIGEDNRIGVGAVIGLEPQDLAYKGELSFTKIGNGNNIREYVQIHRGTKEGSATVLGDRNFLLGFCHLAHNCQVGNQTIIANGALLAGYVQVDDFAFLSGHCLVHQFVRVGKLAMMRGGAGISLDLPPYCVADENNMIRGVNVVGMERRGFTLDKIREVKRLYKEIFGSTKSVKELVEEKLAASPSPEARLFLEFVRSSERGVCRPQA